MSSRRPPPLILEHELSATQDSHAPRTDLVSKDAYQASPMLPQGSNWKQHRKYVKERVRYMIVNDTIAYQELKSLGIDFRPENTIRITRRDRFRLLCERSLLPYLMRKRRANAARRGEAPYMSKTWRSLAQSRTARRRRAQAP